MFEDALRFASHLAESPGESKSRCVIRELGFPDPVLQQRFDDAEGLIGFVDFWWPAQGLVGESDGRGKYTSSSRATADDVVYAEKLREDRLRALGLGVVRWNWPMLEAPERLAARLERAGLQRITPRSRAKSSRSDKIGR